MASKNAETLSLVFLLSSDMEMCVQQPLLTPNFTLSEELLEIRPLAPRRSLSLTNLEKNLAALAVEPM